MVTRGCWAGFRWSGRGWGRLRIAQGPGTIRQRHTVAQRVFSENDIPQPLGDLDVTRRRLLSGGIGHPGSSSSCLPSSSLRMVSGVALARFFALSSHLFFMHAPAPLPLHVVRCRSSIGSRKSSTPFSAAPILGARAAGLAHLPAPPVFSFLDDAGYTLSVGPPRPECWSPAPMGEADQPRLARMEPGKTSFSEGLVRLGLERPLLLWRGGSAAFPDGCSTWVYCGNIRKLVSTGVSSSFLSNLVHSWCPASTPDGPWPRRFPFSTRSPTRGQTPSQRCFIPRRGGSAGNSSLPISYVAGLFRDAPPGCLPLDGPCSGIRLPPFPLGSMNSSCRFAFPSVPRFPRCPLWAFSWVFRPSLLSRQRWVTPPDHSS